MHDEGKSDQDRPAWHGSRELRVGDLVRVRVDRGGFVRGRLTRVGGRRVRVQLLPTGQREIERRRGDVERE